MTEDKDDWFFCYGCTGLDEVQYIAETSFGGPLTEEELEELRFELHQADKFDVLCEAIRMVRPDWEP